MIIDRLNQLDIINQVLALVPDVKIVTPLLAPYNDESFMVCDADNKTSHIVVSKIDLGSLMGGSIDLTGVSSDFTLSDAVSAYNESGNIFEDISILNTKDPTLSGDFHKKLFDYLMWLFGINNLFINEVDFYFINNKHYIKIKRSVIYTGLIEILA